MNSFSDKKITHITKKTHLISSIREFIVFMKIETKMEMRAKLHKIPKLSFT
jgi:hypothetical protein